LSKMETDAKIKRLLELLAEEKTLSGQYFGHKGQARVADTQANYYAKVLEWHAGKMSEEEKQKALRELEKALSRRDYHEKMAKEAKEKLDKVREEIRKLIGGEQ